MDGRLVVETESLRRMTKANHSAIERDEPRGPRAPDGSRHPGSTAGASGLCANACSMSVSSNS